MRFEKQKNNAMKRLNAALREKEVDKELIPMIEYVNSLNDYYTTSGCAGRISLLHDLGSKLDSEMIVKWHRKVENDEILRLIKPVNGIVWFMYEPMIVHIVSRTAAGAKKVLEIGLSSGFKRTGIRAFKEERYMVEICSTERIDVPVVENKKRLVDDDYVRYLVGLANKKFVQGQKKLVRLESNIKKGLP